GAPIEGDERVAADFSLIDLAARIGGSVEVITDVVDDMTAQARPVIAESGYEMTVASLVPSLRKMPADALAALAAGAIARLAQVAAGESSAGSGGPARARRQ